MKRYKSFYNDASGGEGDRCNYPTRLDTYGCGCAHDCNYCYAKSLLSFRKLWNPREPKAANHAEISKVLDKVEPGKILRLGGMTDCFQPIESELGITAMAISLMNKRGIGYLIVTKSDLVASADYMRILDGDLAHIQISVTSTSDEPNFLGESAAPPSKRIEAVETLSKAGFDVSMRVSPYVPELLEIGRLNAVQVEKCLVEFMRVNHWIEKWAGDRFGEYTVKSGGYRHLPLERKIELLEGFELPQMSVCDDVPEHYEWFKENYNYNKEDCCNLRR